jgi:hypothetical protein
VRLHGERLRRLASAALWAVSVAGLTVGLSGCRHRMQIAPLPRIQEPVALLEIPEPTNLPLVEVPSERPLPTPVAAAAASPRRERRRPVAKAAAPAAATVPASGAGAEVAPDVAAIGALTAGGEATPQTKQEAADLIASSEKRLNGFPAQPSEEQKTQISKVKNFLRDAQEALKSGDAEGAKTLATKAKLLLDDMEP